MRHVAVRKILRARRLVRALDITVTVSAALAFAGIATYILVFKSDVVLMEAFVWLSEALSFLGLMVAFHVAASKATSFKARYEFLRLESLSTLLATIIALTMTGFVVYRTLTHTHGEPTPIILSIYPLSSAVASYLLEHRLAKLFSTSELRLVSIDVVVRKLGLDVVFEAAGGLSIIASNLLHNVLAEKLAVLATAAYVYYGLASIAYEATMYLLGVGPSTITRTTRRRVESVVRRVFGRPPARMRIETLGSFTEVEVWLEVSPNMSLESAYNLSMQIAREIVRRVPEVVRAIVLVVPWTKPGQPRRAVARGMVGTVSKRPRRVEAGRRLRRVSGGKGSTTPGSEMGKSGGETR